MAAVPPVDEPTKAILAIFKAMGFSSGAILQREQVEMQFKVNGGNADDFIPALKQGVDRGWFGLPSTITIELTPAGFAECKKA
jgi:hypothetical protein